MMGEAAREIGEYPESFQVHRFKVIRPPNQEFLLFPFGDVHKFAPMHSAEHWQMFLTEAKRHPTALFLGMGDFLELFSRSERKGIQNANLHESSISHLEKHYESLLDEFQKDIEFMRGRLIGMLDGNHTVAFQDGTTGVQRLCRRLGCKYLGDTAFVRLNISRQKGHNGPSLTIFASHGVGGSARTIGGDITPLSRMEMVAEADLFLQGHTHQRWAVPFTRMMLNDCGEDGLRVQQRRGYLVRTGSFLRGYVPGERSYVARKILRPSDMGVTPISIKYVRVQSSRGERTNVELKVIV